MALKCECTDHNLQLNFYGINREKWNYFVTNWSCDTWNLFTQLPCNYSEV